MKTSSKRSNQFGFTVINSDTQFISNLKERVFALLDRADGSWSGTMTEFSKAITTGMRRATPAGFPKNPSIMRRYVNTIAHSLRKDGVNVKFGRDNSHMRNRFVSFEVR